MYEPQILKATQISKETNIMNVPTQILKEHQISNQTQIMNVP